MRFKCNLFCLQWYYRGLQQRGNYSAWHVIDCYQLPVCPYTLHAYRNRSRIQRDVQNALQK